MKTLIPLVLAATLVSCSAVRAEPVSRSALIGAWAVETARLWMPPEARPKSVTITFAEAPGQRLAMRVEIVDAGGGKRLAEGVTALDGTPSAVKAEPEADISATTMPRPDVLVMQLGREGRPASTRVYTASADGQHMVETAAFIGQDGRPVMRTSHFIRVR